jgi:hypothetical protein
MSMVTVTVLWGNVITFLLGGLVRDAASFTTCGSLSSLKQRALLRKPIYTIFLTLTV